MAKKPTEDVEVAVWRARIKRSEDARTQIKEKVWDRNLLSLRGKLKPAHNVWAPTDPWVNIEMVASAVRAAIPSLLYSNPKWTLTPKKPIIKDGRDISWERASVQESWLDEVWRESVGNKHVRTCILAAFANIGSIMFGYLPDFMDDELRGEFEFDEDGNLIPDGETADGKQLWKLAKGEYWKDENGDIYFDSDDMPTLHPGTLQHERFFVDWVPAENLLFDPEGGNAFETHRWCVLESTVPLKQVKGDPRFPASLRRRIQATGRVGDPANDDTTRAAPELAPDNATSDPVLAVNNDEARVRLFDIYDFENNEWLVLADTVTDGESGEDRNDMFLLRRPIPPGYEKGPLRFLKFNEDLGKWYPKTDVEGMAKVELEYNITRSQMMTHRNQSRTRYLETKNAGFAGDDGADVERQKFANGASGTVIQVKDPNGIQPLRKDNLDGSFFQAIPNIRLDFNDISGIAGDTTLAGVDTATQASLLSSAADVKNNDRRDNQVQTLLAELGAGLLRCAQANALQTRYVRVETPDGEHPFEFKPVSPEDLQGEFEVGVVMGSTQPQNSAARVALYEKIVLIFSQNPIIGAAPTLMKRMFEAIDIQDDTLIQELQAIGQSQVAASQENADQTGQVAGDTIGNQNGSAVNAAAGTPTGAPAN